MRAQHQEGVGAHIARLRTELGWSQRELAKAAGLDQSAVSRIEAGHRRVSAAELQRFADLFRVSADALLGAGAGAAVEERSWGPSGAGHARGVHSSRAPSLPPGGHELLTAIERARRAASATGPGVPGRSTAVERPEATRHHAAPAASAGVPAAHGDVGERSAEGRPSFASPALPLPEAPAAPRQPSSGAGAGAPGPLFPAAAPHGFSAPDDAGLAAGAPARIAGEDWAADVAGVVRDWFALRDLTGQAAPGLPWSTGQTAEGKPAFAAQPWQPVIPPPGTGDVLYDRVARFWRSELHVDPDDGPLPDLVPLLEDGLGIQVVVARVQSLTRTFTGLAGLVGDPRPVAATVVSDGVPFVFVNAGRPVVLQRFALVHAFAHLALGHGDVVDESIGWSRANPPEAAANDFAEEFLAPVRAVERWFARRTDAPRNPTLDTLLHLANRFGISAWAALFRSRAAGRLNPRQFAALRAEMRRVEWGLLPRQAFLGGLKDTLAHLTPAEVLPVGGFGPPAVLRVPACMRVWALDALRDGRLSLEDAAAMLRLHPGALADQLDALGLE